MRAPFPPCLRCLPFRTSYSASSRLYRDASYPRPSPWLPSPAILLFRSRKIEYLCKLNGGGIDGRRQIEEVGGEDNHMVRVNLGNNQEGRSNLAKNFVRAAEERSRWLIKLTED